MAFAPITPIAPIGAPGAIQGANPTSSPAVARGGDSFGASLTGALEQLSDAHKVADDLALQAATGDLQAVQDYVIASTEAQLLTQLTVQVRNRAVEAFQDIMRMQV